jgi:hypothetical protein
LCLSALYGLLMLWEKVPGRPLLVKGTRKRAAIEALRLLFSSSYLVLANLPCCLYSLSAYLDTVTGRWGDHMDEDMSPSFLHPSLSGTTQGLRGGGEVLLVRAGVYGGGEAFVESDSYAIAPLTYLTVGQEE